MPHCKPYHELQCEFECLPEQRIAICGTATDNEGFGKFKGFDYLRKKTLNKGLAFTHKERQALGIHGLLPAAVKTDDEQKDHCLLLLDRLKRNLDKYMFLHNLAERNQRLFFQLISSNIERFLLLLYTPTLSKVCQQFSIIYQWPRGMFVTIKDKCHIYDVLGNWPERDIRAVVVTDGERILELGDQGANGMCLPIANLVLYTALAGIKPQHCLPITLDCGTNNNDLILDPIYIGLREQRVNGLLYDQFIDEFMHALVQRFGQNCLIHFEGFSNAKSFCLLAKYQEEFCMFNNDIQSTGAVVLAGILAALRASGQSLQDQVLLVHGEGEASNGIALLFYQALKRQCAEKITGEQVWLLGTEGLIAATMPSTEKLINVKPPFSGNPEPVETLLEAITKVRPSILIGTTAKARAFSRTVLETMGQINERPIILVLSNDPLQVECTAQEAYNHTAGRCFYAAGCKLPLVIYKRRQYQTSQINNYAIFPGVAFGAICAGMYKIPMEVFYIAADTLADLVTSEDLALGRLYPVRPKLFCCSIEIAKWVMEYAYRFNLATIYPEPENKKEFIKSQMYNLNYPSLIPNLYPVDFF